MLELEISTGFLRRRRPLGTEPVAAGALAFLVLPVGADGLGALPPPAGHGGTALLPAAPDGLVLTWRLAEKSNGPCSPPAHTGIIGQFARSTYPVNARRIAAPTV